MTKDHGSVGSSPTGGTNFVDSGMAIMRSVFVIPIDNKRELHVVKEDRNNRIIFSINYQGSSFFRKRITFEISNGWARRLAKWLIGIREANPSGKDQP